MAERVFIRWTGGEQAEGLILAEDGKTTRRTIRGSLAELGTAIQGRPVVMSIPTDEVLLTDVAVPTGNRQRLAQAVPYLLEDQLVEEVDSLHFALGQYREGRIGVAVVAHARMQSWLETLKVAGIQPMALVPELLLTPLAEKSWSVLLERDAALVRTGEQSGFCTETVNLPLLLAGALQDIDEQQRPEGLQVWDCREEAAIPPVAALLSQSELTVQEMDCGSGLLSFFSRYYSSESATNLLQGIYGHRERLGKMWRPWRTAAAVFAGWLVMQGVVFAVEYGQFSSEAKQLQSRVETLFRQGFPDIQRMVNPKAQAERALESLRQGGAGQGSDFLGLMRQVGPVFQNNSSAEITAMSYKDGRVNLDLSLKTLQQLDKVEQDLKKISDLEVEVLSASSREKSVEARLQVRGR